MDKKIISAKIVGTDLLHDWYVDLYYIDETGAKKRKRTREDINTFKTLESRTAAALALLRRLAPSTVGNSLIFKMFEAVEKNKDTFRKKTLQTYLSKLNLFNNWFTANDLSNVNIDTAELFLQHLRKEKKHTTTINAYFATLSRVFELTASKDTNPFKRRKLHTVKTPFLHFNKQQRTEILSYAIENDAQMSIFIMFAFYTLIRPGELRNLKMENIHFSRGFIEIPAAISKNKKTQQVILPKQLLDVLEKANYPAANKDLYLFGHDGCPADKQCSTKHFSTKHQKILKILGYDTTRYKLYSWKHTGALALYDATKDLMLLQHQLRHHSLDQVHTYIQQRKYMDDPIKDNYPSL